MELICCRELAYVRNGNCTRYHGRRGGGRCDAGCVTKRGITVEHALSKMRY